MNFDLDHIISSRQATFRVVVGVNPAEKPDTEATPEEVGFLVVGSNSDEYAKAERESAISGVQMAEQGFARGAKAPTKGTRESAAQFVERTDANNDLLLDHCVVGWFGFRRKNKLVPFTKKDLHALLTSRPTWRNRLIREIENPGNFEQD